MTNVDNIYNTDEMKMFIRKSDNYIMGDCIILNEDDSIDNYEEKQFSEDELKEIFPEKYNIEQWQ